MVLAAVGGLAILKLDVGDVEEADDMLAAVMAHPATPGRLRERIAALRPGLEGPPSGELDRWEEQLHAAETAFASTADLASALRRAAAAHGKHEKLTGEADPNWPDWYAEYMVAEQAGTQLST